MRRKKNPAQRRPTPTETVKKVRSSTSNEMSQSEAKKKELSVHARQSTARSSSLSQASSSPPRVQNTNLQQVIAHMEALIEEKRRTGNYPKMIKTSSIDIHQRYYHGCLIEKAATALNFLTLQRIAGSYVSALRRIHQLDFGRDLNPAILDQVDEQDVIEQENVLKIEWYRANNKPKPSGESTVTDQKKEGKGESCKDKSRKGSKTGPRIIVETYSDTEEKERDEEEEEPNEEEQQDESDGVTDVEEDNEKDHKKTSKKVGKKTAKRAHYRKRRCPVCGKEVVHLRRHLMIHAKQGSISLFRVSALEQMAIKGNRTRTRSNRRHHAKGKEPKRKLKICCLCDVVTGYLATHLRRQHDLTSSQLAKAKKQSRFYEGVTKELSWDTDIYEKQLNKRGLEDDESSTSTLEPNPKRRRPNALELLMREECPSESSSDEEYTCPEITEGPTLIPPTPQKQSVCSVTRVPTESKSATGEREKEDEETHSEEGEEWVLPDDDVKNVDISNEEFEEQEEMDDFECTSDEREGPETIIEFYKSGRGRTQFETLLIQFFEHLTNINGGGLKERHAINHAQNVRKIKETVDPVTDSVNCLIVNGAADVWKKWAKPKLDAKTSRPGTIISYTTSLAKFLGFLVDHAENEVETFPDFDEGTISRISRLVPRVRAWGSAISRMYDYEKWEKKLDDKAKAVRPLNIKDMVSTQAAQQAISFIKKAKVEDVTQKEFLAIRDFLIARLELENAQRPGPIETVTVKHFSRAEDTGKDSYLVYATKHKRSRSGPAKLTMSTALYKSMKVYIEKVRPLFAKPKIETVFITKEGDAFRDGTIGRRVTSWWLDAKNVTYSATALRKMASSTLRNLDPVKKRKVHKHMSHLEKTAEEYYMIDYGAEEAGESHEILQQQTQLQGWSCDDSQAGSPKKSSAPVKERVSRENEDRDNESSPVKRPAKISQTQLEDKSCDDSHISPHKKGSAPMKERVNREKEDSDNERSPVRRPAKKSQTQLENQSGDDDQICSRQKGSAVMKETVSGEDEDSDNERSCVQRPAKKRRTQLEELSSDDSQIGSSKKGSAPMRETVSRENEDCDNERSLVKRPAKKSRTSTDYASVRITDKSVESESEKSGKVSRSPFSRTARVTQVISRRMQTWDTSFSHTTVRETNDSPEKLSGKRTLTQEQLDDVEILFSAEITTNAKVTKQRVRQTMQESLSLMESVEDETVVKAVYDRVRYLQGKHASFSISQIKDAYTFTEEWAENPSLDDGSSISERSRRIKWSEEDCEIIEQAFASYEKQPSKASIRGMFHTQTGLHEILVRNTWARCYEKVRNLFKKRKHNT